MIWNQHFHSTHKEDPMLQSSPPLASRFPFVPRPWGRVLASVAVAVTLFGSAPAEARDLVASLNFNLTTEREEQLREEVRGVFDFAVETLLPGDINCDEGVDGGCHFLLCCDTGTGNCIQEVTFLKTPE